MIRRANTHTERDTHISTAAAFDLASAFCTLHTDERLAGSPGGWPALWHVSSSLSPPFPLWFFPSLPILCYTLPSIYLFWTLSFTPWRLYFPIRKERAKEMVKVHQCIQILGHTEQLTDMLTPAGQHIQRLALAQLREHLASLSQCKHLLITISITNHYKIPTMTRYEI